MGILQVDGRPVWTVDDISLALNVSRATVDNWAFKTSNFPAIAGVVGKKQRLYFVDEVSAWRKSMIDRRTRMRSIDSLRSTIATLSDAEFAKVLMLLDHKASVRPPAKSRVASKATSKK